MLKKKSKNIKKRTNITKIKDKSLKISLLLLLKLISLPALVVVKILEIEI